MRTSNIYFTVLLALSMAACTNDDLQDNPLADGPVAAQVTAGIGSAVTRVNVDDNGSATFTTDDVIHVVAGAAEYTYKKQADGSWKADAPYYFQDREDVAFQAWYAVPSLTPTNGEISINTLTQTSDANGWNQWDILATPPVTTNVSTPTVNFTENNAFGHVMSQVTLQFKAGDGISNLIALSGYTLKSLTTDATFSTLTCSLEPGSTTGDITINGITDASGSEYSCTPLILVPQTITGTLDLEVSYNNQTYKAGLTAPTDGLQPGYSYTYTVTIKNTALEVSNAEISDWKPETGINGEATLQ